MTTDTSARAEAARHAGEVRDTVAEQGSNVAGTAKEQTREVAEDALERAKDLGGELRTTVSRETGEQRDRLVGVIREFAEELDSMSSGSGQSGLAGQATSTVAEQVRRFADSIDGSTGQDLASSVRSFARRRPVTFLAGAALAGVVVGRFVRGVQAGEPTGPAGPVVGSGSAGPDPSRSVGAATYGGTGSPSGTSGVPPISETGEFTGRGTAPEPLEDPAESERPLGEVRLLGGDPAFLGEGRP